MERAYRNKKRSTYTFALKDLPRCRRVPRRNGAPIRGWTELPVKNLKEGRHFYLSLKTFEITAVWDGAWYRLSIETPPYRFSSSSRNILMRHCQLTKHLSGTLKYVRSYRMDGIDGYDLYDIPSALYRYD